MALSRLFRLLGVLAVVAAPASAQAAPTCQEAAVRAAAGSPSDDDLAVLLECESERGPAFAQYLRRLASVGDPAALRAPFGYANLLWDAAVFEALHAVAGDPGAAPAARNYSILALIHHEAGSTALRYTALTSVPEGGTCIVGSLDDVERGVVHGAPLPPDHRERSRALAARLEAEPTTPPGVRSAARCLFAATGPAAEDVVAALDARPVNRDGIDLAYVCGTTFRVRNSNPRDVQVDFEVEGTAIRGTLGLPRNPQRSGGFSEITFAVPQAGTVRLLLDGRAVETATSRGTRCN